ncbi:hypothetical protein Curi_c15010 [Gottschalkia acidurici 9a]|uniref:Uncharacterized protein n=1 Tax=Gottschalkia acidurici (strain ATCC 7906 / DSM 604 / BCRC 14475 / CIP 104303 / KCTC 5404 / NCIMB 10678 / 9a) TaxID=1128398 RepID=K0B0R9_GOTA9|nr:hypothetical protein [Gottschalkia acidurici]AFS78510.1 hypothetical protein Curi_c15010 [Gottschalkia acidurici 9a]
MYNKLNKITESDDMYVFSDEYSVNLKFEEGKWLIVPDENFANATSVNLVQRLKDTQEEMTEE